MAATLLLVFSSRGISASGQSSAVHPLVGAYYYLWYPESLADGTLREHLVPPQAPPAALVDDRNPRTAERDIANARKAGIDFFAIDWWPLEPGTRGRADQADAMNAFLKAPNLDQIKFAMFYETWTWASTPREASEITPAKARRFDADMVSFARRYFPNPSYLHIDGRPVVFLYLTRTMTGDVDQMMHGARAPRGPRLRTPSSSATRCSGGSRPGARPRPRRSSRPRPGVAHRAVRRITAYTLYYGDPIPSLGPTKDFTGYPGTTDIVADEVGLLRRYRRHRRTGAGHPGGVPGVQRPRGPAEHRPPGGAPPVAARRGPASTLDHLFRQSPCRRSTPSLPMIMITAWDEWNEDTGIEPIPGTPTWSTTARRATPTPRATPTAGRGGRLSACCARTPRSCGSVSEETETAPVGPRGQQVHVQERAESSLSLPSGRHCEERRALAGDSGGTHGSLRNHHVESRNRVMPIGHSVGLEPRSELRLGDGAGIQVRHRTELGRDGLRSTRPVRRPTPHHWRPRWRRREDCDSRREPTR